MITGKAVGRGIAASEHGQVIIPYRMVIPEKSVSNLDEMAKESRRWQVAHRAIEGKMRRGEVQPNVERRAQFVEEVLALTAEYVRLGDHGVIVAQADDGRILGVLQCAKVAEGEGMINLLAVDPAHIPGAPDDEQLRGLGTSLVAAASQQLLRQGAKTIFIKPLDSEAAQFWQKRGFGSCGGGGKMCVRGEEAVKKLIGACEVRPDFPNGGDFVVCGWPRETIGARLPS